MATEKKLDCVILGLLSHENLTGYEIKKRLDTAGVPALVASIQP